MRVNNVSPEHCAPLQAILAYLFRTIAHCTARGIHLTKMTRFYPSGQPIPKEGQTRIHASLTRRWSLICATK
jgi:hypothetical protein